FKLLEADEPPSGATAGGPERRLSDDRVQATGDYVMGSLRLETKAQWQRHSLVEVSDTGTGPTGTPFEGTAFDLLLNTTSLDVLAHHGAGSALRGTVGVSGLYQTNDTRGPIPLVPDARVRSAAGFAFEQATRGRWSALAGGRVDVRRLTADGNATLALAPQQRDYTAWSGDVGVVYRPIETVALAANAGRAWRAPTLFGLFPNGPHLGGAGSPRSRGAVRHPADAAQSARRADRGIHAPQPRSGPRAAAVGARHPDRLRGAQHREYGVPQLPQPVQGIRARSGAEPGAAVVARRSSAQGGRS